MKVYCLKRHLDKIDIGLGINEGNEVEFWVGKVLGKRVKSTDMGQVACVGTMLG